MLDILIGIFLIYLSVVIFYWYYSNWSEQKDWALRFQEEIRIWGAIFFLFCFGMFQILGMSKISDLFF